MCEQSCAAENTAYEIGKAYMVPCIKVKSNWVPVIPVLAEDSDVGLRVVGKNGVLKEQRHWHVDHRFNTSYFGSIILYNPDCKEIQYKLRTFKHNFGIGKKVTLDSIGGVRESVYMSLRCQDKTKAVIVDGVKKCAHKGATLQEINGVLVCPNHHSMYDKNTLELLRPNAVIISNKLNEGFQVIRIAK